MRDRPWGEALTSTEQTPPDRYSVDDVVAVINPAGAGDILLVCEHGHNHIPAEFSDLGLTEEILDSHIAWDPGALPVAEEMSRILDAPLVVQLVSRLVYDCNRTPEAPSAIPEISDTYPIPGNAGLSGEARRRRIDRFYMPFRDRLTGCIDNRPASRAAPAIVTVHSFTPVLQGVTRDVDIGILHDADARLADAILDLGARDRTFDIRRNAPYGPEHGVTHTLREHALPRGLLNVMLEIRSDLIADRASQQAMAERIATFVTDGLARLADAADAPRRAGRTT